MASERKVRLKALMMVLALVVCANIGDLTMKRGMTEIGAVDLSPVGHWWHFQSMRRATSRGIQNLFFPQTLTVVPRATRYRR